MSSKYFDNCDCITSDNDKEPHELVVQNNPEEEIDNDDDNHDNGDNDDDKGDGDDDNGDDSDDNNDPHELIVENDPGEEIDESDVGGEDCCHLEERYLHRWPFSPGPVD